MKKATLFFLTVITSICFVSAQTPKCTELISYAKANGRFHGEVNFPLLMESSWLHKVTSYKIDNTIVVIAEIKDEKYSFITKEYIFCGVTEKEWYTFSDGWFNKGTYGERFHDNIMDNLCNCE